MAKTLRYHPSVTDDIAAAIDWYDELSIGLGGRFRSAVDARFDNILGVPLMFPRAFGDLDYRFARIPKFPYLVLYYIRGEVVHVLGVFHSASDPTKWRLRG